MLYSLWSLQYKKKKKSYIERDENKFDVLKILCLDMINYVEILFWCGGGVELSGRLPVSIERETLGELEFNIDIEIILMNI